MIWATGCWQVTWAGAGHLVSPTKVKALAVLITKRNPDLLRVEDFGKKSKLLAWRGQPHYLMNLLRKNTTFFSFSQKPLLSKINTGLFFNLPLLTSYPYLFRDNFFLTSQYALVTWRLRLARDTSLSWIIRGPTIQGNRIRSEMSRRRRSLGEGRNGIHR